MTDAAPASGRRFARRLVALVVIVAVLATAAIVLAAAGNSSRESASVTTKNIFAGTRGWFTVLDPRQRVVLVEPNHPNHRRVILAAGSAPLQWSPDGSELLVNADRRLFLLDKSGTLTQMTAPRTFGGSFSPDGSEIIYNRHGKILHRPTAGGAPHRFAPHRSYLHYAMVGSNQVAPYLYAISFLRFGHRYWNTSIWTMNRSGSFQRPIASYRQIVSAMGFARHWRRAPVDLVGPVAWLPGYTLLLSAEDSDGHHCAAFTTNLYHQALVPWGPRGICPWDASPSGDGKQVAMTVGRVSRWRVQLFDGANGTSLGYVNLGQLGGPSIAWRP